MDQTDVSRLQGAVQAAKQAAHAARLSNCDVGDLDDAFEALEQELAKPKPNANTVTRYLNSVARSLIGDPAAQQARDQIDAALRSSGLPATWEQ